jgi:hypothetical protein
MRSVVARGSRVTARAAGVAAAAATRDQVDVLGLDDEAVLASIVEPGRLPVWEARRIAEQTIPLSAAAAGFVDAQLAGFAHQLSLTRITRCVEAAVTRHHPDLAKKRAEAAAESRGVWLDDDTTDGTTRIHAITDTPDAHAGTD